jgi:hypothetical protein
MVPSVFVYLDQLPLTTNGKLDRKGLPDLKLIDDDSYVSPRNKLEEKICQIWSEILNLPKDKVGINDNFFKLGGNSLSAVKLVSKLNNILSFKECLTIKNIYLNPTLKSLAILFIDKNQRSVDPKNRINFEEEVQLDDQIKPPSFTQNYNKKVNVFLTGATGFVGVHLLHELIEHKNIKKIFCLIIANTVEDAFRKIINSLEKYDLSGKYQKIVPVIGNLEKPFLGLSSQDFTNLAGNVDQIIHSAVFMDHLQIYDVLKKANVEGTKEIIAFAFTKKLKPVHFISTINIFSSDKSVQDRVYDENTSIFDQHHYYSQGYAASKWVSEGLLNIARNRGGL